MNHDMMDDMGKIRGCAGLCNQGRYDCHCDGHLVGDAIHFIIYAAMLTAVFCLIIGAIYLMMVNF